LDRTLPFDCDPVHDPTLALVVVDRIVLHAAIVPEGDRIWSPAEAAREFWAHRVPAQVLQLRPALLLSHVSKARCKRTIAVRCLASCLDMGAHHRLAELGMRRLAEIEAH